MTVNSEVHAQQKEQRDKKRRESSSGGPDKDPEPEEGAKHGGAPRLAQSRVGRERT